MDIRQLKYFTAVAERLSFTKAASFLHVSQPSLSKAIKQLEEELHVALFHRSSKQLQLTDAGKAVLLNTKHVLDSFDNLTSELSDIIGVKKGEIKIGIPPIVGAAFFSSLISQFIERYPKVDLKLTEVGSKRIKQGVDEGTLDVGFICNIPLKAERFETTHILRDPLVLITHTDHPLAARSSVHVAELEKEAMILYDRDFSLHDSIVEECLKNGFYPKIVCESSQKDFMLEMVSTKLGVALLPSEIALDITKPSLATIPFEEQPINLNLGVIRKKNGYMSFALRAFIDTVESFFQLKTNRPGENKEKHLQI